MITFAQDFIWLEQIGGNTSPDYHGDWAYSMVGDEQYLYIAGHFQDTAHFGDTSLISLGERDVFIAKTDTFGNCQWVIQAGGVESDYARSIALDGANIYIAGGMENAAIFGDTTVTSSYLRVGFVAKYDTAGNFHWVNHYNGSGSVSYGVTTDINNNLYVTGWFENLTDFGDTVLTSYGSQDIFITKHNQAGDLMWVVQAGDMAYDKGCGIVADNQSDPGIYLTGTFDKTALFGDTTLLAYGQYNGFYDIFLAKYDTNGNFIWARKAGGYGYDTGHSLDCDEHNSVYMSGIFKDSVLFADTVPLTAEHTYDNFIAKYSGAGDLVWVETAGGGSNYDFQFTDVTYDDNSGNIYVSGGFMDESIYGDTSLASTGDWDIFVAELNANGNYLWVIGAGGTQYDKGASVWPMHHSVYACGGFQETAQFHDTTLITYGFRDAFICRIGVVKPFNYSSEYTASQMLVYPNPGAGLFHVTIPNSSIALLEVYTIHGQRLMVQQMSSDNSGKSSLNLKQLPKGVYVLRAYTNRDIFSRKIIIR